jgi:ParB family transcriptional regulator, chromosome partitioning protein
VVKRRGLGRGLDALLGATAGAHAMGMEQGALRRLPLDVIRRGRFQPRLEIASEALEELAQSIRVRGVVQPIVVRADDDGEHYEIVAGERRWRAAQLAGLGEIPAVIREVADDEALAIALIENIQREDLNAIEEANALRRLVDEFGLTHQGVADAIGRSRAAVSNLLRLLDLAEEVRSGLERGELDMGHARALLGLEGELQVKAAREVIAKQLTARQTEQLVRRMKEPRAAAAATPPASEDPDVRRLSEELGERIGARVQIRQGRAGKGRLVIHYGSLDELDGILEHIK